MKPGVTESSWEPRWLLLEDGLAEYLALVDRFKASDDGLTFAQYCLAQEDPFALAIGESPSGRCGFDALAISVTILGIPTWFSSDGVKRMYEECRTRARPLSNRGVMWSTLETFVRRMNVAARTRGDPELCQATLAVNQRQCVLSGPDSALGLDNLLLAPGIYLVAGHTPYPTRRSHAFVLEVTAAGRFASDADADRVPLVDYAFSWLGGVQFVRRVVLRGA